MEIIYPKNKKCLLCKDALDECSDYQICSYCRSSLTFSIENYCKKCGRIIYYYDFVDSKRKFKLFDTSLCIECNSRYMYFDQGVSAFEYSNIIKDAIHNLKYNGDKDIATFFGEILYENIKQKNWDIDIVAPVPLYKARQLERGYNQAALISREISRQINIKNKEDILFRIRDTKSQVTMNRNERIMNIKNAFIKNPKYKIEDNNILLVDDVLTTASTINECSRILKENGAKKVYIATAACAVKMEN